jgi:hypothetical protein
VLRVVKILTPMLLVFFLLCCLQLLVDARRSVSLKAGVGKQETYTAMVAVGNMKVSSATCSTEGNWSCIMQLFSFWCICSSPVGYTRCTEEDVRFR